MHKLRTQTVLACLRFFVGKIQMLELTPGHNKTTNKQKTDLTIIAIRVPLAVGSSGARSIELATSNLLLLASITTKLAR